MPSNSHLVATSEAVKIVEVHMGDDVDVIAWLKRNFHGRTDGMTRSALLAKIKKTLETLRDAGIPCTFEDEEPEAPRRGVPAEPSRAPYLSRDLNPDTPQWGTGTSSQRVCHFRQTGK